MQDGWSRAKKGKHESKTKGKFYNPWDTLNRYQMVVLWFRLLAALTRIWLTHQAQLHPGLFDSQSFTGPSMHLLWFSIPNLQQVLASSDPRCETFSQPSIGHTLLKHYLPLFVANTDFHHWAKFGGACVRGAWGTPGHDDLQAGHSWARCSPRPFSDLELLKKQIFSINFFHQWKP